MYVVQVSYEEDEERHELIVVSRVYTESAASASGIVMVCLVELMLLEEWK